MLQKWLSLDFAVTKRHIGMLLTAGSLIAIGGAFAVEIINPGFGGLQKMSIALGSACLLLGLTLLPLGNRPA